MRGAKIAEIQRRPHPDPLPEGRGGAPSFALSLQGEEGARRSREGEGWAIAAKVLTQYGEIQAGTGRDAQADKRIVRINGETAKGQNALAEYLSCVWLTPQMDRIFLDAAGTRRRFLDRLVFAFDPGHSGRITRYENAMGQRVKLLRDQQYPDPAWLEGLEATMAESGVAVAAARLEFISSLQRGCDRADMVEESFFPRAQVAVTGVIEELLRRAPALEAAKGMSADQCSTGEQKALLIGIVLAHARMITAERGAPPVILLDEVAAHLDENRRAALYDLLLGMKAQVWLTGTDNSLFSALGKLADLFCVEASCV
jgi:DNA replication and repair protein RecF